MKENRETKGKTVSTEEIAIRALIDAREKAGSWESVTVNFFDSHKDKLGYSTTAGDFRRRAGLSFAEAMVKAGGPDRTRRESIKKECPSCRKEYESIGIHWRNSSCNYPEITEEQKDILIGVMMGDASFNQGRGNIQLNMVNKPFLCWLDDELGVLANGVKHHMSAEESAKQNRDTGLSPNAKAENYADVYRLDTVPHPSFEKNLNWMTEDGKRFPEKIEKRFNSRIAKFWYISDGGLKWENGRWKGSSIAVMKESERLEWLVSFFSTVDEIEDRGIMYFFKNAPDFLETIGSPVPGFEYKWETDDYGRYKELHELSRKGLDLDQYNNELKSI